MFLAPKSGLSKVASKKVCGLALPLRGLKLPCAVCCVVDAVGGVCAASDAAIWATSASNSASLKPISDIT